MANKVEQVDTALQGNGPAEVTNKTILDGLKKRLEEAKGTWADKLDYGPTELLRDQLQAAQRFLCRMEFDQCPRQLLVSVVYDES